MLVTNDVVMRGSWAFEMPTGYVYFRITQNQHTIINLNKTNIYKKGGKKTFYKIYRRYTVQIPNPVPYTHTSLL